MITTHINTSIVVLEDVIGTFDTIEHSTNVAYLFGDKDIGRLCFIVEKVLSILARSRIIDRRSRSRLRRCALMWLTPGQHEDVEGRLWGFSMWMFNIAKRGRVSPYVDMHKSTLQQLPSTHGIKTQSSWIKLDRIQDSRRGVG